MAWVTQGLIANRTRETLAISDSGIVLYRKLLMEQARKAARGKDPMGVIRLASCARRSK